MNDDIRILKSMVRGAYDLQMVRMQTGLRLCANFRAKLKIKEGEEPEEDGELSEEAQSIIDKLKESYRRLTDGVARNRKLPAERGFIGDELISNYPELVLVNQYIELERQESAQFRQMSSVLENIPIYVAFLRDQKGVGPALAAVLITYLDPHKARHVSSFWKYSGLDVAGDGSGRSRKQHHLVERTYTDKNGKEATRMGVTYNPWLKMKLMGGLAPSFLRSGSEWRSAYDNYKHRLDTDPTRDKCTVAQWKKKNAAGEDVTRLWTPGRIHQASQRYMVKMFLAELWTRWRKLENLPVTPTYHEAKQGHVHSKVA